MIAKRLIRLGLKASLRIDGRLYERELQKAGRNLEQSQLTTLNSLLAHYTGTELGRSYNVSPPMDADAFRAVVPICDYESFRPFIEREVAGDLGVIRKDRPSGFTLTSGTTAAPKLLPVYAATLKLHRRALSYMMYQGLKNKPDIWDGRLLRMIGAAAEQTTAQGLPIGSKSGQMSMNSTVLTRLIYEIPDNVFSVPPELKYLAVLRYACAWDDLKLVITPNPSTVLLLADTLRANWPALLRDLQAGGFHRSAEVPEPLRSMMEALPPASAPRLAALSALGPSPAFGDVFPSLSMISCWTSGSSALFIKALRREVASHTTLRDLGYIASETHATLPFGATGSPGIPTTGFTFFEFVPKSIWEEQSIQAGGSMPQVQTTLLHELIDGEQYYVFVTTADGLLRYHINDIVRVNGSAFGLPLLEFVQKGLGVTNITGEKLSEFQVLRAVDAAEEYTHLITRFALCVADASEQRYTLYCEPRGALHEAGPPEMVAEKVTEKFAEKFDNMLAEANIEYAAKRESGRLLPARVRVLKSGAGNAFRDHCVSGGMREGQFKFVALRNRADVTFAFESWFESAAPPLSNGPTINRN